MPKTARHLLTQTDLLSAVLQDADAFFGIGGKALPHRSYAAALLLKARPSRPVYPETYVDTLAPIHVPITVSACGWFLDTTLGCGPVSSA